MNGMMQVMAQSMMVGLVAGAIAASPRPAVANVRVPVNQMTSQLRQQTRLPIMLPDVIPGTTDLLYFSAVGNASEYTLNIDYRSDCGGAAACSFGGLIAFQGGVFEDPERVVPGEIIEWVQLANGVTGQYQYYCGVDCTALMSWQVQGVLYNVYLKDGRLEDVVAIANGAIAAGFR